EWSKTLKFIGKDEEPVITQTVQNELKAIVDSNKIKGMPIIAQSLRVVPESVSSGTRAAMDGLMRRVAGREGDIMIGGTALDSGRVLLSTDKELVRIVNELGGVARRVV